MSGDPGATVIITARDRWHHAGATLEAVLQRTDERHRTIVVDGAAPSRVASTLDRLAATGRIEVIRRGRFLATNEARRIAVDAGIDTDWVAFLENDCVPSDDWVDSLIAAAERTGAASAFPVYLQDTPQGRVVHGTGADLEITDHPGGRRIREIQHHLHQPWADVCELVTETPRDQAEPHCIVVRRDFLESTGGPDPELLGWFEHLDLALHHIDAGVQCLLVPDVTCLYRTPDRVPTRESWTFMLRWGRPWIDHSRARLCERWGLDPDDEGWRDHENYRRLIRHSVPVPRRHRTNAAIARALDPLSALISRRWFSARSRDEPLGRPAPRASRR